MRLATAARLAVACGVVLAVLGCVAAPPATAGTADASLAGGPTWTAERDGDLAAVVVARAGKSRADASPRWLPPLPPLPPAASAAAALVACAAVLALPGFRPVARLWCWLQAGRAPPAALPA